LGASSLVIADERLVPRRESVVPRLFSERALFAIFTSYLYNM